MARTNEKTESDMISCIWVGFTHVLLANYIKNIDNEFCIDQNKSGFRLKAYCSYKQGLT